MLEILSALRNRERYDQGMAARAEQLSDFQLGKEIAARNHLSRELILRNAIGMGALLVGIHSLPPEIVFWGIPPAGTGIIAYTGLRALVRERQEIVLFTEMTKRYPQPVVSESAPTPQVRSVQVFPK